MIEGLTGLALMVAPSLIASILLGVSLDGSGAIIIARLAGAALVSLAVACFFSRSSIDASGVVKAMLFYNGAATALLLYGVLYYKFQLMGLVPFILLHAGLTVWCIVALAQKKKSIGSS